jgi:hypothetical protein
MIDIWAEYIPGEIMSNATTRQVVENKLNSLLKLRMLSPTDRPGDLKEVSVIGHVNMNFIRVRIELAENPITIVMPLFQLPFLIIITAGVCAIRRFLQDAPRVQQ